MFIASKGKRLLLAAGVVCAFASHASANTSSASANDFSWTSIHVNGIVGAQGISGSYSASGQLSWAPALRINESFDVRGNLGATLFKSAFDKLFPAIDAQVLGAYNFSQNHAAEVGGGVQHWVGNGGLAPIVSGNYVYRASWVPMMDRMFVGYSHFLLSGNPTSQVRAGIGLSF